MFPETLLLDEKRIIALRDFLFLNVLVGSTLLVTVAAFPNIQNHNDMREKLRDHMLAIIDVKGNATEEQIKSRLESAALQIITDIRKHSEKHSDTNPDAAKEELLKSQIIDLSKSNNRVRQLVQRRILEFVENVFTSNTASPVQMPKGLTILQQNLSSLAGQFMRIASHNRTVYGDYYVDIIADFLENKV